MELLRFKPQQFAAHRSTQPKGWHLMNTGVGQQGEYTLCGVAFDGDATGSGVEAETKQSGRVTCPKCVDIIRLCKQAKI